MAGFDVGDCEVLVSGFDAVDELDLDRFVLDCLEPLADGDRIAPILGPIIGHDIDDRFLVFARLNQSRDNIEAIEHARFDGCRLGAIDFGEQS